MKIQVRKIRPEGMELEESFPSEWVGLTQNDDIRFIAPAAITAKINRADDELIAQMSAASQYETKCYRCLDVLKRDWTTDFTLIIDIEKRTEFIELDEDIRQELILNLPPRILCFKDCKGLCIDCGINLNQKTCQHKHAVVSG